MLAINVKDNLLIKSRRPNSLVGSYLSNLNIQSIHTCAKAFLNKIPSFANLSMFGVTAFSSPYAPILGLKSSTVMRRTLNGFEVQT